MQAGNHNYKKNVETDKKYNIFVIKCETFGAKRSILEQGEAAE